MTRLPAPDFGSAITADRRSRIDPALLQLEARHDIEILKEVDRG
jgi:hypothetical protein